MLITVSILNPQFRNNEGEHPWIEEFTLNTDVIPQKNSMIIHYASMGWGVQQIRVEVEEVAYETEGDQITQVFIAATIKAFVNL